MAKEDSATLTIYANTNPAKKSADDVVRYINARKAEPRLSLGKINADFTKFQDSLDSATARVIAFTATTSLIYGVGNAFTRLTQDAIKIESVMTRIQSIFGSTASDTKRFQTAIFDLANGVGLSFYQVAEAAEEFSRQGLSLNKTLEATRAAAIVAKLSGAELKGVIEGLTATLSTFNDGTLDYIQVANKLVALDSAFATSAAGITEGLKRVSGVAAEAGLSFDQTAAAITALKQVTGRSEAVIGNSLKSIFTSLQTEKVQKDLSTLGVETKDASGEFRNLIDVLSDLSKVYQTLGDSQKALIAQKIGKTYQANAFQGILRTFETGEYGKAISISENAGSSAEDRIEKLNKTTEAALTRFGNNITKLGGTLGDKLGKPLVEKVAGYFNNLIEIANTTFGDNTIGDSLINGLKNVLEGPGVAIIAITLGKLLARITRETAQAVKSVAGITGRKENILEIEKFITQNLSDQNVKELEKVKNLDSVAARQKAILSIMQEQLAVAEKNRFASPLQQQFGVNLGNLNATKARKIAKKIPNRAVGDPAVNEAMIREAIDIQNGVGGARSTAIPQVKTLNLGRGPEKVVVNSDEKIVPNFAGSGQHAIFNREMMGYAGGSLPKVTYPKRGSSIFTEKHFRNKDTFYRVVHGDAAFKDIVDSGLVRTRNLGGLRESEGLLGKRPTAFPSFSKGEAAFSYAYNNPEHYIISTTSKSMRPSTHGRHGKGKTQFPTDTNTGEHLKSLDASEVRVFKHIGDKKYKIVYDRGILISKNTPSFAKGKLTEEQLDKLSKNILRQVRVENAKRLKSPYANLLSQIPTPGEISPLTQSLKGLDNYKFTLPLGSNYFRKDINEGISEARRNQFIKDFQKEFSKELDKVIATKPVSFETVNRRGVRRPEVRQPSNLKYKPTGNFFDFRNNEFLKSVSPFDFSNRKYSFAGSGNAAFLQKGQRPVSGNIPGNNISYSSNFTSSFGGSAVNFSRQIPRPLIRPPEAPSLGGVIGEGVVPPGVILPQFFGANSPLPPSAKRYQRGNYNTGFGAFYRNDPRFIIGASSSVRPDTKQRLLQEREDRKARLAKNKGLGRTGFREFYRGDPRGFVGASSGTVYVYGMGSSSRVFYDYAQENKYAVKDNIRNAGTIVRPIGQNVISSDFSPVSVPGIAPRSISGINVSRPKLPRKITPEMTKALVSMGYDKDDIKKMGVRGAYNILNPGSDFSKAPIGSSSLGGTPATKVQVTQPLPNRGGLISASISGQGISNVRAGSINAIESPRDAFYRERQEEFSRAQARAEKISKVIDKGGILTNSAKSFIKSNPSLFSESQISKAVPSRGGISQRIGSGIRGLGQNAVGAGLGISFVGGIVAEGLKKDGQETQSSRAIGGISKSVGLGATAGIFGATAGGIGLIAGALVGLNEAFGENLDSLNGLSKSHEKLQEKYQKESRAINSYVENFSALADAISSGSQEAAKAARANISASLSQIEDKSVVNKLLSAGSVRDLSGITNDINSQRERELAGKEAVSFAAKLRQENRRTFLGLINGRNYAPGASTSEIGDIIAKSIDYSKLPKNFTESDLPEQAREAIKIFSDGFKGFEIILDKIRKQSERSDAAQKIPDKISKIIESSQAQFGVIKGASQKASFEILNQQISRSLANSISEINLDSVKSSISDSSYARSKFLIDRSERYNKYSSDVSGINQTILDKAVELTKDKTFSYEKLGQIKSSFSGFSENGDIKKFLDSFGSAIGTDSKELNQFAQNQFLELRKLNAEFLASSKIAQAQQNALLSEIKKNSLLKLFGGGAKYDKPLVSGGIGAVIGSPVRNKYDVNGFGLDAVSGRKTYTRKQYAEENSRVLGLNASESERGLSTIKYLYENGYYGIDNPNASPEIKALRESRLSSARKKAAGFFENISRKNAEEDTLLQTGRFIEGINKDAKLKTGSLIFGGQEKSDIDALIKEGSSESLKEAASYVGNILGKSGLLTKYPVNSDEFNRMNDLMTFLLERSSEIGNISESSKLQAETSFPSQTETQKQTEWLKKIQTQESIANENLSHIASLIAAQDARMQSNQRLTEYNAAKLDVSKLEAERRDSYEAFGSLVSRYNESNPLMPETGKNPAVSPESNPILGMIAGAFGSLVSRYNESNPLMPKYEGKDGIKGFRETLMDDYYATKKAGGDTTNLYSMIKESRNIRSLEDITSDILDKRKILEGFKDVQNRMLQQVFEGLKSTFEKAAPKLNDFLSGSAVQSAQLSININSSESSIYSSDEFKSELKDFIVEYTDKRVNKKIKDNLPPGRRFVDIPDGMLA